MTQADRWAATAAAANPRPPELLAPAGDWDCAKAAVENGADAIYFGLDRFNARMRAHNFTEADLPELMAFLHRRGVKGYVTLNTLVFPDELEEVEQYLRSIITAGVDAAIVQDIGLCRLIRHLSPDFPLHASTQMTVTSAAGIAFAKRLGCELVVLARECSIADIEKIQAQAAQHNAALPLEVFVHGALCVAYSGQCLTSEALGGRSANRGECAQACRMPYDLVVDGEVVDLVDPQGDRRYLLSPQDLSGLAVLPELVQTGVACLKIEGRLKAPEYVASVTRVYRQALDRAIAGQAGVDPASDRYELEMAFSRGLYTGWFEGIDNQQLVQGHFAKKRGVYLGSVSGIHPGRDPEISIHLEAPLKPGDGVVFAGDYAQGKEQGGRVYAVEAGGPNQLSFVAFGRRDLDLRQVKLGDRLYKTSDPELERRLRQSFSGEQPQFKRPVTIEVRGSLGEPLVAIARDTQGHIAQATSQMPLAPAQTQPLSREKLQQQLGRLGNTAYTLSSLVTDLEGDLILPVSELNHLRRSLVEQLDDQRSRPKPWQLRARAAADSIPAQATAHWTDLAPGLAPGFGSVPQSPANETPCGTGELTVLVRQFEQLQAVLSLKTAAIQRIYCEFEDPSRYRDAVRQVRQTPGDRPEIWVAAPRITKPKERYILEQVRQCQADGYLIRNYDQLEFFAGDSSGSLRSNRCIADFCFNIANPITAGYFKHQFNLEHLTASYDLNAQQLRSLLVQCPPGWFEVTIHQHMPMFHMEHCVFCAFLSDGKDFRDCGRPCEQHEVKLRDRVGKEHLLHADAGCRNTLYNGTAQTGAEAVRLLQAAGLRHFRLEFLHESVAQVQTTIQSYQQLLQGQLEGWQLWQTLKLQNQLGVTRGAMESGRSRNRLDP